MTDWKEYAADKMPVLLCADYVSAVGLLAAMLEFAEVTGRRLAVEECREIISGKPAEFA